MFKWFGLKSYEVCRRKGTYVFINVFVDDGGFARVDGGSMKTYMMGDSMFILKFILFTNLTNIKLFLCDRIS